jgi:dolichyl-phosphate beta-glucosyltransferase
MMASTIDHLTSPNLSGKRTFEILVVDDGSTDGTSATALQLASKYSKCNIRVVTLEKNVGKGGAVRHGMLYASGERLLMADADGASRIEDLEHLWKAMDELVPDNGPAVVVGSRAHLVKSEAVVKVCVCHSRFYLLLVLNIAFLALLHSQYSHVWPTHYSANCRCRTHS